MAGIINFETFLFTGVLLNLTPGNNTIFILSRSIGYGRNAGIMSVLGIATGSLIHTTLAAFGLSIIISKSILAFDIIKYLGAAYLIYLGIKMLIERSKFTLTQENILKKYSLKKIYRDAVLTNVLNPKVALFFIAFLPQFIDPGYKASVIPFLLLGITFTITGTTWCLILAVFSSKIFSRLRSNQKLSTYLNKTCGFILIALGLKVALTNKR